MSTEIKTKDGIVLKNKIEYEIDYESMLEWPNFRMLLRLSEFIFKLNNEKYFDYEPSINWILSVSPNSLYYSQYYMFALSKSLWANDKIYSENKVQIDNLFKDLYENVSQNKFNTIDGLDKYVYIRSDWGFLYQAVLLGLTSVYKDIAIDDQTAMILNKILYYQNKNYQIGYKTINNYIKNTDGTISHLPPSVKNASVYYKNFINTLKQCLTMHPNVENLIFAIRFVLDSVLTQPFQNGNTRTASLMLALSMLKLGLQLPKYKKLDVEFKSYNELYTKVFENTYLNNRWYEDPMNSYDFIDVWLCIIAVAYIRLKIVIINNLLDNRFILTIRTSTTAKEILQNISEWSIDLTNIWQNDLFLLKHICTTLNCDMSVLFGKNNLWLFDSNIVNNDYKMQELKRILAENKESMWDDLTQSLNVYDKYHK